MESHEPDLLDEIKDHDTVLKIQEDYTLVEFDPATKHLGLNRGAQKTPFWTEDIINLAGAARNLFSIQKGHQRA